MAIDLTPLKRALIVGIASAVATLIAELLWTKIQTRGVK
jgi:hypothetical protein